MKKSNELSLSDAIQSFLAENQLKPRLAETRVRYLWEKLMGKTISTYTSNITLRRGTLQLSILSAPLRQELSFAKEKIMQLLNEELGEEIIKEVVIR